MAQPPEYRGNLHRKLAEINTWTRLRHEPALEPELPVIDPHHHLRDDQRGRYMIDELREDIETCITEFGPERCMMESNFPPDKQTCGYGVLWNAFKRITQGCSPAEKSALYHDTAARVYRLDV